MIHDAVIVVPGIMGSELVDAVTGRLLWGLKDPCWYVRAWTSGASLEALKLSEAERAGRYGRVRAAGLLRFPAFAPVLRGFEPYTDLVAALQRAAVHPAAVGAFPYDWRLPVAHNAALLAEAAARHLASWRRHPAQVAARRTAPDEDEARLVIVAHSMGGLLARHLSLIPGASDGVRATLTLGTPFYGVPKAALLLATGNGMPVPLPAIRVRQLAATLPGVYDLLATYRCLDAGTDARHLTPDDVAALGGDRDLAEQSARWQARVGRVVPPGHVQVVGAHQPTVQALTVAGGVATCRSYTCRPMAGGRVERIDLGGDGTVPRESAQLPHTAAMPLAQAHGAIARSSEAILIAVDVLTDRRTGPWQGAGCLGLGVADVTTAGSTITITVTGAEHPRHASCQITDVRSRRLVAAPSLRQQEGHLVASASAPGPGLYRVEVAGGGTSAVSQVVMVSPLISPALRRNGRDEDRLGERGKRR
jgi:hypothetical protein